MADLPPSPGSNHLQGSPRIVVRNDDPGAAGGVVIEHHYHVVDPSQIPPNAGPPSSGQPLGLDLSRLNAGGGVNAGYPASLHQPQATSWMR